jgi:hypothetical protein
VKHPRRSVHAVPLALAAVAAATAAGIGCAGVSSPQTAGGGGVTGRAGSNGGGLGGAGGSAPVHVTCSGLCTDFPSDPIIDPGTDPNAPSMFNGTPSGSGPCIMEPEDGTLFPNNWLRPQITATGISGIMQITIHSDMEANNLVAYTKQSFWRIPKTIWTQLASHVTSKPISVTVRGTTGGSSQVAFTIAPVNPSGSMVFWAADPTLVGADPNYCRKPGNDPATGMPYLAACSTASELRGFAIGDESTEKVLGIADVQQTVLDSGGAPAPVVCIGCHTKTPDDGFVSFVDHYPWRAATASVSAGTTGASYSNVSAGGLQALEQPGWGPFTYTKDMDFWVDGKRIGVASLGYKNPLVADASDGPDKNDSPDLVWINLQASMQHTHVDGDWSNWIYATYSRSAAVDSGISIGVMAREGDSYGAATPNWSHDGTTIVYASTNAAISGRLNQEVPSPTMGGTDPSQNATPTTNNPARTPGLTNLYTVPFANGMGGPATPLTGAATPDYEEYYPAYSPDDQFIVFTRVPKGEVMYKNPHAEIALVPAAGGDLIPINANKPPACSGKVSPGVNNHWAKWSPDVGYGPEGRYYWVIFSSNRNGNTAVSTMGTKPTTIISQLYLAPVVATETGGVITYPAIYLWNQPADHVNTTPAWETFDIPIVP